MIYFLFINLIFEIKINTLLLDNKLDNKKYDYSSKLFFKLIF